MAGEDDDVMMFLLPSRCSCWPFGRGELQLAEGALAGELRGPVLESDQEPAVRGRRQKSHARLVCSSAERLRLDEQRGLAGVRHCGRA